MRVSLYYSIRRCLRLLITNRIMNNQYSRSFYSFLALYTWKIVYNVVYYIDRKLQNYMQLARKMFPKYSRRCQIGLLYIAGTFSSTRTDSLQNEDIYQYIYVSGLHKYLQILSSTLNYKYGTIINFIYMRTFGRTYVYGREAKFS